jgi:hypothetical protein
MAYAELNSPYDLEHIFRQSEHLIFLLLFLLEQNGKMFVETPLKLNYGFTLLYAK